jgi:hypothetical protein
MQSIKLSKTNIAKKKRKKEKKEEICQETN